MKKKHILKFGQYTIILGSIAFAILLAIAFDVKLNEKEEFPWFTSGLAVVSAISVIVFVVCVIAVKKRR